MASLLRKSFKCLAFIFFPFVAVTNTHAQNYFSVAAGSKYICSRSFNGTNFISTVSDNNRTPLSEQKTIASVNTDIKSIQGRIQKLNKLVSSLKDGKLTTSEINTYKKIRKSIDPKGGSFPVKAARRKTAIKALIALLKVGISNRKIEIAGLTNCKNYKFSDPPLDPPVDPPSNNNLTYEFIKFKGLNGVYTGLIMYLPYAYDSNGNLEDSRWYCVKGNLQKDGKGVARLFTTNPCKNGLPVFPGNDCSQFTPDNMYSEFYGFRLYLGSEWELDNPIILQDEKELLELYTKNLVSRPRTSQDDKCEVVP